MLENAADKNIDIDCINGYVDHLHCLLRLDKELSVVKVIQLLKGESSFWINKNKITVSRFEWGTDYYVRSVARHEIDTVRRYIANQDHHHIKTKFGDDFGRFMEPFRDNYGAVK